MIFHLCGFKENQLSAVENEEQFLVHVGCEGHIIDAARPDMSPPNQGPTLACLKAELEALSRQLQEHQSQRLPIKVHRFPLRMY